MKKKKNMDKRKLLGTVLGIIAFVTFAIYFTYAWYSWKSENSTVNLTIKDASIECTVGPSVDVKNIGPVLNIEDGVKTSFSLKNTGSSELSVSVGLNITSISSALRVDSFKWALIKGTAKDNFDYDATPLFTGTFSKLNVGNNTLTSALKVAADSTSYFQFVVYIDGNVSNPEAMMNGSLKAILSYGDCGPLTSIAPGSYVEYTGDNGCSGKHCEGQNANYVSDSSMGYCNSSSYKFQVNGWRVAYVKDGSIYLVSAGAPECVATYVESISSSTSTQTLSTNYYYGSGYTFSKTTGKYSLTGVTSSVLAWSSNYSDIIANTPYTCLSASSTGTCEKMYKITAYSSSTQGTAIPYYNYDGAGVSNHIAHLNEVALKYCNTKYAYNGVCDSTSSWSINDNDYQILTTNIGATKTLSDCQRSTSNESCGYNNDLIDNGGHYWFATSNSSPYETWGFLWYPQHKCVYSNPSRLKLGVRPILRLRSSISVVSGSGTYEDPYVIE